MHEHTIFTNNFDVAARYPDISCYMSCSVLDVFVAVRNAIHKGAKIITHPLSGSIKPNVSPYKSVAISTIDFSTASDSPLDYKSLQIIEDTIATLKRLPDNRHQYDESVLQDFRIIDLDHISCLF